MTRSGSPERTAIVAGVEGLRGSDTGEFARRTRTARGEELFERRTPRRQERCFPFPAEGLRYLEADKYPFVDAVFGFEVARWANGKRGMMFAGGESGPPLRDEGGDS